MKRTLGTSLILVTGALSAIASITTGQTPCVDPIPLIDETVKIMATPVSIQLEGDRYGTLVGVSGDYAVSGGIQQFPNPLQRGFAIVHYRHQGGLDQWGQIKRLTASDPPLSEDNGDQFGISSGISGDFIIVGSHLDDPGVIPIDNAGSAYIFNRHAGGTDNWGQTAQLVAPDAESGDRFGFAVAIDGDLAIVGSRFDDDACVSDPNCNSGSVYIFRRDGNGNWNFEQKFSGLAAGDEMGFSVDIAQDHSGASLDLAVAGAPLNDDGLAVDAGAAYVFRYDGSAWALEATLIAPELADPLFEENFLEAQFGTDVACWRILTPSKMGDLVVAGAPLHDLCGVNAADWGCLCDFGPAGGNEFNNGAAYVFQRINDQGTPQLAWDDGFMLVPLGCQSPGHIGLVVDVEDRRVIITSRLAEAVNPSITQRAHLYQQIGTGNTWSEELTLYPVAVESSHDFGNSIALSGGTVIVGAHIDGTTSEGRSYVYNGMGDCDGNGVIDALEICSIPSLDCTGNDILDECEVLGCTGDIAPILCGGNGIVNIDDLVGVLNAFGPCPSPPATCPEDIVPLGPPVGNGVVNIDDLVAVLNAFGDICAEVGASSSGATGALTVVKMNFSNGWVDAAGALADPASNGLISAAWVNFDQNWDVYRLFANVSDSLSTLTYCGGGLSSGPGGVPEPLVLNPGKGAQFYIPIAGSYAPPNVALFSMSGDPNFQLAAFGTYLSFGMAGGSPPVAIAMGNTASLDGLLTGFVNAADAGWGVYGAVAGQGVVSDGNGGWRVMIGQFAVPKGKTFTAAVRLAGDGIDVYSTTNSVVTTLP